MSSMQVNWGIDSHHVKQIRAYSISYGPIKESSLSSLYSDFVLVFILIVCYTLDMSKAQYKKGYKEGYNNPGSFNQSKLLKYNDDLTKGIVAGICQRAKDKEVGTVKFIFS